MRLEDRVRGSLKRRAQGISGDPESAWESIQERLSRRRDASRRWSAAAVALAIALTGGAVALRAFFGSPATPDRSGPVGISLVEPTLTAMVPVDGFPRDIAVGDGVVWVAVNQEDAPHQVLVTVDPTSNEVRARTPLEGSLTDLVATGEAMWGVLRAGGKSSLYRFDAQGTVTARVDDLHGPLTVTEQAVWAVRKGGSDTSVLVHVDTTTSEVVGTTPLGETAWYLTGGDGAVWVLTLHGGADLLRVDAETGEVTARLDVPIPGSVGAPLAADGWLWVPVARSSEGSIARLDGTTGELVGDPIPMGVPAQSPLGASAGGVWFLGDRPGGQIIARLDREALTFDSRLLLDEAAARPSIVHAAELSTDGGTIWIANHRDSVTRVDLVAYGQPPAMEQPGVGAGPTPPPNRWCNQEGECASLERYEGEDRPYERSGPGHCGWNAATFIAFRGGQYVRDERGDVVALAEVTYDASAILPQDARPTGWRRGAVELWLSPSEIDAETGVHRNIYLVHRHRVERLPHFSPGCA